VFQDCQLFDTSPRVHTPFNVLAREMPAELKAVTRLMHYNHPPEVDANAHGFWGFVQPREAYWL
jgi:hypothetical protein